ncbi:60S acidic ribosomal protein P2 [Zancudomyces culisetae]|uniref:60S acidic ribosomal protein P2 n=1 Tax=Zancudomyces culisetae TaxID=1213189 RepID=A0A1R1PSB6_ZANCU|nr:60S acidic ribosomal protein P2 [Zancudomyces culisetae]|eukprot:OMH83844.1 60S acidic ribosomal protein P2 [Zancudomyces culisetae]
MRYIAAYLLLHSAGSKSITADDIKNVISSVGIEVDEARAAEVVEAFKGKSVETLIAEGATKLASVPSGGAAAAGGAAAPAAGADAPAAAAAEPEPEEESDDDMGFGLFD